jgi:hypothetical protein
MGRERASKRERESESARTRARESKRVREAERERARARELARCVKRHTEDLCCLSVVGSRSAG